MMTIPQNSNDKAIPGLSHVLFIPSVQANHMGICYDDAKLWHHNFNKTTVLLRNIF